MNWTSQTSRAQATAGTIWRSSARAVYRSGRLSARTKANPYTVCSVYLVLCALPRFSTQSLGHCLTAGQVLAVVLMKNS